MSAYVYYQGNRYDEAIAAAERFVELHPGHRDAAYGYYLIAISHYEQISGRGPRSENDGACIAGSGGGGAPVPR